MKSNYNKTPRIEISKNLQDLRVGWDSILSHINDKIEKSNDQEIVLVLETYQGVDDNEVKAALEQHLSSSRIFCTNSAFKEVTEIEKMVYPYVTDDRTFGFMTDLDMEDFFDQDKISWFRREVQKDSSKVKVVYGFGASLCVKADLLVYIDMARWEIQQRMRRDELGNMGVCNRNIDVARRYKQSFFVDWRVLDRHKMTIFDKVDYFIDTNKKEQPKLLEGDVLRSAYKKVNQQPFRVVPFFDPGPWGGQWMKEVMDLDRSVENYAWSFDCVPEENSILLGFGDQTFETPATNLILREPTDLLGSHVTEKFGAEFPIRFDFLDTMKGGNLSLQVHPSNEYIKKQFGMPYTQDESYYVMAAEKDAVVYLGFKDDVEPDQMMTELREAQENGSNFDAEKYVATYPVKKHDHILIPNGTIHCSAQDTVVLEISATPFIFTFKLWDWGRMGLDGQPRPIHLEHGEKAIDWSRREDFSRNELINKIERVGEDVGWIEERTGLYPSIHIETRRHWFTDPVLHNTNGGVNVLNLVEGREAIVESPSEAFEPFVVHYAETFIVPAAVGAYTIRPFGESEGRQCATIKAYVRN